MDEYKIQVEREYIHAKDWHSKSKRNGTGCQDVLRFMVENFKTKIWWWSWEFVGKTTSKGGYLSHRAPARASDLALQFPELVEDRKIGRFKIYRVRVENKQAVLDFLNNKHDTR